MSQPPDPEPGPTWRELLADASGRLAAAGHPESARQARRLVEEASGYEGAELQQVLGDRVPVLGGRRLADLLERRLSGEPLQYVLGRWGFRTLDLMVDRRVLIPRPETEVLVDHALAELDRIAARTVVDLGTGSGAIALSIAAERPGVEVWATERSSDALIVARSNLSGVGRVARHVRVVESTWFDALPSELAGTVDLVVSNPPYVAAGDELPAEVADWEPTEALVAGPRGTEALEAIMEAAPRWLRSPGALVLEIAPHQAGEATERARAQGFPWVSVAPDLSGRDRVLVARRPG